MWSRRPFVWVLFTRFKLLCLRRVETIMTRQLSGVEPDARSQKQPCCLSARWKVSTVSHNLLGVKSLVFALCCNGVSRPPKLTVEIWTTWLQSCLLDVSVVQKETVQVCRLAPSDATCPPLHLLWFGFFLAFAAFECLMLKQIPLVCLVRGGGVGGDLSVLELHSCLRFWFVFTSSDGKPPPVSRLLVSQQASRTYSIVLFLAAGENRRPCCRVQSDFPVVLDPTKEACAVYECGGGGS